MYEATMAIQVSVVILFILFAYAGISVGSPATFEDADNQIAYYLRNRELGNSEILLTLENLNVVENSKPIYFITHGWNLGVGRNESWIYEATDAYLAVGDNNVVHVDWPGPVSEEDPALVVIGAQLVAKSYGRLLASLINDYSVPPSNIHVAGHSIGAHLSGMAAKIATKLTGTAIAQVTALDPANFAGVESTPDDQKLTKDDANVVVVIHSNGGMLGLLESLGAVDFFPNGAKSYGRLLASLIVDHSVPPSNIRVAGHSIGAHLSGMAAKIAKKLTGTAIAQVTALDAANFAGIESTPDDEKLAKDDANVVMVIHTSSGGLIESLGAVDFFPNGGTENPACEDFVCNHVIANEYFVESIHNSNGFLATKCESYEKYEAGSCSANKNITLGGQLAAEDVGDYYFDTNSEKPYSKE